MTKKIKKIQVTRRNTRLGRQLVNLRPQKNLKQIKGELRHAPWGKRGEMGKKSTARNPQGTFCSR